MALQGVSVSRPQTEALFEDVLVPRHITKTFTYLVPTSITQRLQTGSLVKVPFGGSVLEGVVVSINSHLAPEITSTSLKTILALVENEHSSTISPTHPTGLENPAGTATGRLTKTSTCSPA